MQDKWKTLRHLYLAEKLGNPLKFDCECGRTHAVLSKDFDLIGEEIIPKQLVRLKCIHHFYKLEDILKAKVSINIEAEFHTPMRRAIGGLIIKFYNWRFNRASKNNK